MITARGLAVGCLGFVLSTQLLSGQSARHYREFPLGGDLASVSALSGVAASEAKVARAAQEKARLANEAAFRP